MERISRLRSHILLAFFFAILVLYSIRLYSLQIIETDGNTDNTTVYTSITRVKAARGDLLDRNGNVLIGNRASYDLVFNHYVAISSDGTNESLHRLVEKCRELGISYVDHFPVTTTRPFEYTLDNYTAAWRGYFQTFLGDGWIDVDSDITAPLLVEHLREVYEIPETWSDDEARAIIGLRYELDLRNVTNLPTYIFIEDVDDKSLSILLELNIPGLGVEASTVREYHTTYAAHILGTMGAMTAEQWPEFKEQGYSMDALIGQSGFEAAFESELHAVDGTRVDVVDKEGTVISQYWAKKYDEDGNVIGEKAPQAGNNVETTIDLELQMVAEDALADLMAEVTDPERNTKESWLQGDGLDAEGAAVVVMKVKTGEILACASYPTYNLETYNKDFDILKEDPLKPIYNRALQAAYPPGSTYKMTTLISAMNNLHANLATEIEDKMVFDKYEGFRPVCMLYSLARASHGVIDCRKALEVSCNYFFYELGDLLTNEELDATAKGLGLGEPTGIELPENIGHRSNRETKAKEYSGLLASWFQGDQILTAIGQAENRFTPMQLAVYTSTLANKGIRYKATFLSRVVSSDYRKLISENQPEILSQYEICNDAVVGYFEGMRQVITGVDGTGARFFGGFKDNYLDGTWDFDIAVCAKTGTAETIKDGRSDNGSYVCFAPMEDPEIAVVFYGERIAHGSSFGKPAETILKAYFSQGESSVVTSYENQLG